MKLFEFDYQHGPKDWISGESLEEAIRNLSCCTLSNRWSWMSEVKIKEIDRSTWSKYYTDDGTTFEEEMNALDDCNYFYHSNY